MVVNNDYGDPGNTREGEPTAALAFPGGLVQLGDRTEQPGELHGQYDQAPNRYQLEPKPHDIAVLEQASDKYAIVNLIADQRQAYQLLPASQDRKTALIMCMAGPIYMGEEDSVANAVGLVYTTTLLPANVFVLAASNIATSSIIGFQYTSKQGLYVTAASATAAQVQCIVERFSSGTPVR